MYYSTKKKVKKWREVSDKRVLEVSACREGLLGDDNGHVCPVVILTAEEVSGCNYSVLINSAFLISDSTIVIIINLITVL